MLLVSKRLTPPGRRAFALFGGKQFWLGLSISVVCLSFFLARTDFAEIRDSFSGANYALAFAAVPLYFVVLLLRTIRWRILLRPVRDIPARRLYPIAMIGLMANNIAPARVGEVVRAYLLGEKEALSKSTALGTIAIDRAFDGLTLVAFLSICTAIAGANARVQSLGIATAISFFCAATVLVLLAFSPTRARSWALRLTHFLPERPHGQVVNLLDSFLEGLASIRQPWSLVQAAVLSVASWLVEAGIFVVVGRAFSLHLALDAYLLTTAAPNLALAVFASPGGIGPFEVTTREILVYFGNNTAAASAYALALHALLLGPVILTGFVLLWMMKLSLSDVMVGEKGPKNQGVPD